MRADSVGAPVTPQQWDYIHDMGGALRESLDNVTAVFAPSCIGHAVLTKRDWLNIKIDDISFAEALRCWERSTGRANKELSRRASDNGRETNKNRRHGRKNNNRNNNSNDKSKRKNQKNKDNNNNGNRNNKNKNKKTPQQQERHRLSKERRQQQRRRNNGGGGGRKMHNGTTTLAPGGTAIPRSERSPLSQQLDDSKNRSFPNHLRNKKNKNNNNNNNNNNKRKNHGRNNNHKRRQNQQNDSSLVQSSVPEPSKCALRLLERCSWPQCNHSCPSLTNPLTGEEMRFLELLASFGLDIEAVATALGVDMQTLNNMDRTVLVNLLTQTSS